MNFKKIVINILALLLCLMFVGCQNSENCYDYILDNYNSFDDAINDMYGIDELYKTIEGKNIKVSIYKTAKYYDCETFSAFYYYFVISPLNMDYIKIKDVKFQSDDSIKKLFEFDNSNVEQHGVFSYHNSRYPFIELIELEVINNANYNKNSITLKNIDYDLIEDKLCNIEVIVKTNKGKEVFEFKDIEFPTYTVGTDISEIDPLFNRLLWRLKLEQEAE